MEYATYQVSTRDDLAVNQFKEAVLQLAPISWVICFEADRWRYVEAVVLAHAKTDERVVGMATIAPCDEMGKGDPEVIGVWVHPSARKRGIGIGLVKKASEEVQKRYEVLPVLEAYSQAGYGLVRAAEREGLCHPKYVPGTETFCLP